MSNFDHSRLFVSKCDQSADGRSLDKEQSTDQQETGGGLINMIGNNQSQNQCEISHYFDSHIYQDL